MGKLRSALMASTFSVGAAMAASPALAGEVPLVDFMVVEHHSGDCNCGTYTLYNDSDPGINAYELFVSNPDPYNASVNGRKNWGWNTFSYGSGSGVGGIAPCGNDEQGVFENESGFCYFDFSDPSNPVTPGHHAKFSFNSNVEDSTGLILYTDDGQPGSITVRTIDAVATPEPATLTLFGGVGLIGMLRRRRKGKSIA